MIGFITGARYWLIVLALASAAAFAGGYLSGLGHAIKLQAGAPVRAAQAQAHRDLKDRKEAEADTTKRAAANAQGAAASTVIYRDRFKLVQGKCVVPGASMKKLNDPALVGEVQ